MDVCLGLIFCRKIKPQVSCSFLAEAYRLSLKLLVCFLLKYMMSCVLTKLLWLLEEKQLHTMTDTKEWVLVSFLYKYPSRYTKPTLIVCCNKALFLSHLNTEGLHYWHLYLWLDERKCLPLMCHPNILFCSSTAMVELWMCVFSGM